MKCSIEKIDRGCHKSSIGKIDVYIGACDWSHEVCRGEQQDTGSYTSYPMSCHSTNRKYVSFLNWLYKTEVDDNQEQLASCLYDKPFV